MTCCCWGIAGCWDTTGCWGGDDCWGCMTECEGYCNVYDADGIEDICIPCIEGWWGGAGDGGTWVVFIGSSWRTLLDPLLVLPTSDAWLFLWMTIERGLFNLTWTNLCLLDCWEGEEEGEEDEVDEGEEGCFFSWFAFGLNLKYWANLVCCVSSRSFLRLFASRNRNCSVNNSCLDFSAICKLFNDRDGCCWSTNELVDVDDGDGVAVKLAVRCWFL